MLKFHTSLWKSCWRATYKRPYYSLSCRYSIKRLPEEPILPHPSVLPLEPTTNSADFHRSMLTMLLHMSKSFGCDSHSLVLAKIWTLFVRTLLSSWLSFYLSRRFQVVNNNVCSSQPRAIKREVSQSNVIDSLPFLLHINIIFKVTLQSTSFAFAGNIEIIHFLNVVLLNPRLHFPV